jgi:hypothetical protein
VTGLFPLFPSSSIVVVERERERERESMLIQQDGQERRRALEGKREKPLKFD